MPSKWPRRRQTGREKNADSLRLPAQLQDELMQAGGGDRSLNRRRDPAASRKERRKKERKQRRLGQARHWQPQHQSTLPPQRLQQTQRAPPPAMDGAGKRGSFASHHASLERPTKKKFKTEGGENGDRTGSSNSRGTEANRHGRSTIARDSAASKPPRKRPAFDDDLDAHDEHIAMLERRLGLRKGSNKDGKDARAEKRLRQELEADGLGFVDRIDSITSARKPSEESVSGIESSKASKNRAPSAAASPERTHGRAASIPPTKRNVLGSAQKSDSDSEGADEEEDDGMGGLFEFGEESDDGLMDGEEGQEEDGEEGEENSTEPSDAGACSYSEGPDTDEADFDSADGEEEPVESVMAASKAAPKLVGGPAAPGKYVPPALRGVASADAARSRQMRGLLNRLSENNLPSVVAQLSDIVTSGRQRVMIDELVSAVLGACISSEHILAPLALTNAAAIRALSLAIGPHVCAIFVEALILRFEDDYAQGNAQACCNAILLLAQLYNFGAIHCTLIYELVRRLIVAANQGNDAGDASGELELNLLLKLLGAVGPQLRSDDPAALVEMIKLYQSAANSQEVPGGAESIGSSRKRVFSQMLTELKNNRLKMSATDGGAQDRLRKTLRKLEANNKVPALKAGWDELVHAEERGRWWLVGSAWAGRSNETAMSSNDADKSASNTSRGLGSTAKAEARLLSLAGEQRLNTDVRKAVFVAIMGADDYIHAFDRINKLKLKKTQKAEVVRVLMHCCSAEATFNAFYALLAARLCGSHREYKFALHFAMWDVFKELNAAPLNKVANTAKLLAVLLKRGALPVTVLKVVRWHDLDQREQFFWQVVFCDMLSGSTAEMTEAMMPLVNGGPTDLRDGILVFIKRNLERLVHRTRQDLAAALANLVSMLNGAVVGALE